MEQIRLDMDPATLRARALAGSRQILEACARKAKGRSTERPSDVLEDIGEIYNYEPWDIALVAALTAVLHPRTRIPQTLRAETARITAERRRLLQALRTFRQKFMAGERPTVSFFQVVLAPRPGVGLVYTTGRPSEWVLDEFAGCILVILGRARIHNMAKPALGPIDLAFDFGRELLGSVGIEAPRRSLDERVGTLPDLPPEPTDEDPLGWANVIARRLTRVPEGSAVLRRIFVPEEGLSLETFRYGMRTSSPGIFVRRFTRKALPNPS